MQKQVEEKGGVGALREWREGMEREGLGVLKEKKGER